MKNKQQTQIDKAYSSRVNALTKNFTVDSNIGLNILVEQLKYIRDSLIIKASHNKEFNTKISSLIVAVNEFEAYQKSTEYSQKVFHLNNFFEFVKLNMEDWLKINDTV